MVFSSGVCALCPCCPGAVWLQRSRDGGVFLHAFVQISGFARHNVHFQVSVKVTVSNVPGCIDNVPKYFVLKSFYDVYITLFGATPQLDTVCPNGS